ncbi:LuxR C-terminal-related transcriptional regulator [Paenibacillus sp. FSL H3-0333]|uniref:LuxR C-terminal-related transcriptional regulator n=1 Tax=Paenibacillus sp. FSL H3-0333 TaxID=2921373 RepID=UPI0030FCE459
MKNKLRRNLQSLQDAYASLCGLTIIITDQADKRITEPSGLTEMASLLFGSPCATAEHAIANLLEKVRNVSKTIVYETRSGLKMLITSIGISKQRPYYILTGVWVDGCTKELITGRIHETVPPGEWEDWIQALDKVPVLDQEGVARIISQLDILADTVQALLEREQGGEYSAYDLQLMNLIYLLDPASPEWLQGILGIVVRILGVEFAGYASNAADGDQFTVVETTGMPKDNSLQGASFFYGEGFLGQVGLSKQMGYWRNADRDLRISFFAAHGVRPKVLICYPIKYKDKLYGLLYAGDPVRPELTEEQADMGMLVAHQLAASMYHMESEALYERQRKRHDTYKEIVQGILVTQDKEDYLQLFIEFFQQQLGSPFMCLLLHTPDEAGLRIYSSSSAPNELYTVYAEDAEQIYFADGIPGFNLLNKPIRREWKSWQLVEHPMVFEQRLLGLFTVQFSDEGQRREYETIFHMTNVLLVTKLLAQQPQNTPSGTDFMRLLQDNLLIQQPVVHSRAADIRRLAQDLLEPLSHSAEEMEWIGQAALLAPYPIGLLREYLGDIPAVCVLRHMHYYLTDYNGQEDVGESSHLYLAKVLLMLTKYTEQGGRQWKETLPIPVPEPLMRSFEQLIAPPLVAVQQEGGVRFTTRENDILDGLLTGLNNKQIAEKLFISTHTVKNHITKIYEKLGVHSRSQAISQIYQATGKKDSL